MADTKGITVKVDANLHEKVKTEQEALAVTLSQYIEMVITEHFEKGGKVMNGKERTLAVQISEDLFQRIKAYLAHYSLKQKDFIIDLIEDALQDFEDEQNLAAADRELENRDSETARENDELGEDAPEDAGSGVENEPHEETGENEE